MLLIIIKHLKYSVHLVIDIIKKLFAFHNFTDWQALNSTLSNTGIKQDYNVNI